MNNNNINSDNDDIYYEFQSTLNFSKVYKLNLLLLNNSKNSEINQTKYLQLINSIFPSKNNKFNTLFNLIFSRFKSLKCDLINEQNTYYITKISDENTINIYNLCCALIIFIKKDFEHKLKYLFKLSDLDSDNLINEFELIKLIQTLNILFCEEICTIKTESTILAQSLIEIKIKEILNLILYEPANLKKIFLKDFYIDFQTLLNRISKIDNYKFILFPCFVNMKKCLNTKRKEKKIVINKFLKNDFFKINSDLSRNVKLNKNYLLDVYTKNEIRTFNENETELKKNNRNLSVEIKNKKIFSTSKNKNNSFYNKNEKNKNSNSIFIKENKNNNKNNNNEFNKFKNIKKYSFPKKIKLTKNISNINYSKIFNNEITPGIIEFKEDKIPRIFSLPSMLNKTKIKKYNNNIQTRNKNKNFNYKTFDEIMIDISNEEEKNKNYFYNISIHNYYNKKKLMGLKKVFDGIVSDKNYTKNLFMPKKIENLHLKKFEIISKMFENKKKRNIFSAEKFTKNF